MQGIYAQLYCPRRETDTVTIAAPETATTPTNGLLARLYPNPTQNYVMVEVPTYEGNTQLTIFDLQGRQHIAQTTTAPETRLDITTLPSGMYFVQIQQGAQRVTQKLVVQK